MSAGRDPLAFRDGVREDEAPATPKLAKRFGATIGSTSESGVFSKFELDDAPYCVKLGRAGVPCGGFGYRGSATGGGASNSGVVARSSPALFILRISRC